MATALRRPRIAFSALRRPWWTGAPDRSSSLGNPEQISAIDTRPKRRVAPRYLSDHRPLDAVFRAQGVGPALPEHTTAVRPHLAQAAWNRRRKLGCDQSEKLRLLPLCLAEILIAVEPKQAGDGAIAVAVEEHQSPAESRGRDAHGGKRVPDIVLAVPERALTVLPGFSPKDGRQTHEEGSFSFRERRYVLGPELRVENRSPLESVVPRRVVVHGRRVTQPVDRGWNGIALGRMKIAARRVRAQGPRRPLESLPRRQRQCVPEEEGNRLQGQWLLWHGPDRVELPVGKRVARIGQRETNEVRSCVPTKGIGLGRPVHVAERCGELVEVVLCPLVVGNDHLFRRGVSFERARPFQRTWPPR